LRHLRNRKGITTDGMTELGTGLCKKTPQARAQRKKERVSRPKRGLLEKKRGWARKWRGEGMLGITPYSNETTDGKYEKKKKGGRGGFKKHKRSANGVKQGP